MGTLEDPFRALLAHDGGGVLAFIIRVDGPSYRPVGAAMAVLDDGTVAGTLSSGCVEADVALHALQQLRTGQPKTLRYGRGSPVMDIQLPCGGGLEILLIPSPDTAVLDQVVAQHDGRRPVGLDIHVGTGAMTLSTTEETGLRGVVFGLSIQPALRFAVFGKGPEASTFAALVHGAGYLHTLFSPDPETRATAAGRGCNVQDLTRHGVAAGIDADPWTAVILFFHDHDWEPPIIEGALKTGAFYIGAQGSLRARDARIAQLISMGVSTQDCSRLFGPVGLIPSARDPGTLAVSVLAEILAEAPRAGQGRA